MLKKEPVIIAVHDGFWGSQEHLLPVDSFAITCQLYIDSGKIERELLMIRSQGLGKLGGQAGGLSLVDGLRYL